jgi:colanic acid/amylovoran biosynthesis glycosyltransferase
MRPKITVASFDFQDAVSGPGSWLRRMAVRWIASNVDVSAVFLAHRDANDQRTPNINYLRSNGISVEVVEQRYTPWLEGQVDEFHKLIVQQRPDLFIANCILPALWSCAMLRKQNISTAMVMHSWDPLYQAYAGRFVAGQHRVDDVVCVSQRIAELLRHSTGNLSTETANITHLPTGTPIPDQTASWGEQFTMTYVGRFEQEAKRVIETATAMGRATLSMPDTHARLIGSGSESARLRQLADERFPQLKLVGRLEPEVVQTHLLNSQVLVLLSDYEGMPTSVMEAMACGVVPIITPINGVAGELVVHEHTGLIVSDREGAFVDAVQRLRSDRPLWERLSKAARSFAITHLSSDRVAQSWIELCQATRQRRQPDTSPATKQQSRFSLPSDLTEPLLAQARRPALIERAKVAVSRVAAYSARRFGRGQSHN